MAVSALESRSLPGAISAHSRICGMALKPRQGRVSATTLIKKAGFPEWPCQPLNCARYQGLFLRTIGFAEWL